ncbi:MAG: endonuclease domain-containing protein [Lysobacter sp.]|nr:MAG: endonuclease domain-containing protein [Lysobacter sp.]
MREQENVRLAKRLRRHSTDAERVLWHYLRNRALIGLKFRRQCPIGPFIADFVCIERRLVIEVDGGQHVGCERDESRTVFLESEGFRVLRFWNDDVLTRIDAVLSTVCETIQREDAPHPNPSPASERGAIDETPSQ